MSASRFLAPVSRRLRGAAPGRFLIVAVPLLSLVVAACASASGAPADTYAPAASLATRGSPSAGPVAMPSASAMAMPPASAPTTYGSPAPAPSVPAPSAVAPSSGTAPAGATVRIAAQNIQFDTDKLAAPAGQPWVLEFANNDAGVPHNVEIRDASGASVFKGQIVTGPTKVSYQVAALSAGTYTFLCDVHPTMTGTLTVA